MKVATLKDGTRDGRLVVVSRDLTRAADATDVAPTLLAAVESWATAEERLRVRFEQLESGTVESTAFDPCAAHAPAASGTAVDRRLRVRKSRAPDGPRPASRPGELVRGVPTRLPGRIRRLHRAVRRRRRRRGVGGDRLRGRGGRDRRRGSHADASRGRRASRQAPPPLQRRQPAELRPARALDRLRVLQRQAVVGVLPRRGHARRAGRRVARRTLRAPPRRSRGTASGSAAPMHAR